MKKIRLSPFGKKLFSFLAAGTFLGSSATFIHHEKKEIENNSNSVIESLDSYKDSFDDETFIKVSEPKDSTGHNPYYYIDGMQVISLLEESAPIFYKYNSSLHLIKTPEQKQEFEKAMHTIYSLNIDFIEIENMKIKEIIAPELNISSDKLTILYELSNRYDQGRVSFSVEGDPRTYHLSDELEDKIEQYKKNILLTQGINYNSLSSFEKQDIVGKILDNISSSRNDIIEYCKNTRINVNRRDYNNIEISKNIDSELIM